VGKDSIFPNNNVTHPQFNSVDKITKKQSEGVRF